MKTEIEIHPIQAQILKVLLFKTEARFRELNITGLTTDFFSFHLRQLKEGKLIHKLENNSYELTRKGKEFANRLDTESLDIEKQAKLGVSVMAIKTINKTKYYLVQQRLKQPYYGFFGSITGKVRWGETVTETAIRELYEETGLRGRMTLCGISHKMDYAEDNRMLEDKFFFAFKVEEVEGKLIEEFEGGKNSWMTKKKILKLPNLFPDMEAGIKLRESDDLVFMENKYIVGKY